MFQLTFENQTFRDLSDFELDTRVFPPFAQAAISFCREWLSGQQVFTQQTSGSTGAPKQILLNRLQMLASADATGAFFHTHSDTKLLCCLSPEYIAGKMMLVRAMLWDCPIELVEPSSNPLNGLEVIPDFVALVPLQVETILKYHESLSKLKQIGKVIIGGAPISDKLQQELTKNGIEAWQTYGMTETVSHIALAKIGNGPMTYHTLPGVEIGQDDRGALWVKSAMSGPEIIQTNDLVKMGSPSSFVWTGRADFVVNSGGIKLHPELLEKKAETKIQEAFPDCRFFFFGEKDDKLGQRLILILESLPDEEQAKKLQAELGTLLEKYELPKAVYFSKKFSETANGKINRQLTYQSL